jgi:hypothetical protein
MRELARAAVMEGRSLAAQGYRQDAAQDYMDALAAGAHIGHGTTLIENLVGLAMQVPAAEALLDLPASAAGGRLDYVDLAERLEYTCRPTRPLTEGVQLERASFLDSLQNMYEYDPQTGGYVLDEQEVNKLFTMVQEDIVAAVDREALLRQQTEFGFDQTVDAVNQVYDETSAALALPYQEGRARLKVIEERIASGADVPPLVRALAPSFERAFFIQARAEAARRAAQLVANLNAHRQRTGSYPESLSVFSDRDFATDPFTGEPFRYRLAQGDFTLYSLGANGADDGGVHDPQAETNDYRFWPRPK